MPVKFDINQFIPYLFLRFTKALIALFCSGGVFCTRKNPKLSIYIKPYFATSVLAQVAFFYACKNIL